VTIRLLLAQWVAQSGPSGAVAPESSLVSVSACADGD
jgi:hypothetical protein